MKNLTAKRLSVLTIIQNYYLKNIDRTTAAELFFGQSHSNLWIVLLKTYCLHQESISKQL